jgi:invasion protein IalB
MGAIVFGIALFAGVVVLFVEQTLAQVPQRATVTYDDWTGSCATAPEAEGRKTCEMVQTQTIPGQSNPVGQITISRASKTGPLKIFFQVPANVWLQTGVKFIADDKEPGLVATFRWCIPARCLADFDLGEEIIKRLRARTEPGRVELKDAAQHDISLPVSFRGFTPALDSIERQ